MVTIRSSQMGQLSLMTSRDFENRMLSHLREFFAEDLELLDEEAIRGEIRYGIRRAKFHGFESELDVCRYIDLMVVLGSDFDADPDFIEIQESIYDSTLEDPTGRMDHLYRLAMSFLERGCWGQIRCAPGTGQTGGGYSLPRTCP